MNDMVNTLAFRYNSKMTPCLSNQHISFESLAVENITKAECDDICELLDGMTIKCVCLETEGTPYMMLILANVPEPVLLKGIEEMQKVGGRLIN